MKKKDFDINDITVVNQGILKGELPSPAKRVGSPPKPESEKDKHPISLKFKDREWEVIIAKSGRIPKATYVKDFLIEKGFFD